MAKIPLAGQDRARSVAKEPLIALRNRFAESNPVLSDESPAFIARPALKYWQTVGEGPIRATFQQPGAFDGDAFVVSYNSLYRMKRDGTTVLITDTLSGGDTVATVRMTATGDLGDIRPRLWMADGRGLMVYEDEGFATSKLTASAITIGDVVQVGTVYYRLSNVGSLETGAPAGTVGSPWRVLIAGSVIGTLTNLYKAINATGVAGTDYSTALTAPNPDAAATVVTGNYMIVRALASGLLGNTVATTETGAGLAWSSATTTGGGSPSIINVVMPDDVGAVDVAHLAGHVIVIPAQGVGLNGRFYWVEPGEVIVDPLNFATAERAADAVNQVVVFNDQFWLPGQDTTEVWYMTGDPDAPVQRLQGVVFDRGVQPGTAIQVKDAMFLIDEDGGVFLISGGEKRISTPDIAERIRKAIAYQNIRNPNS